MLVEHAADALHGAAGDLALDDVGVDHRAAVLAHDVAEQRAPGRCRRRPRRCTRAWRSPRSNRCRAVYRALASSPAGTPGGSDVRVEVRERRRSRRTRCRSTACPRTLARLSASSMSSGAASSLCAAIATMRSRRIAAVSRTAPAVIEPLRLPPVPAPKPVTAVSPWMVRDVVDVDAERVGGELDDGGLDAVPGRAAGDVDVDLARRLDADRRRLGARSTPKPGRRRLDVVREPDAEVAAARARPRPARRGTRRSRASRAPARTSRAARCCRRSCRSGSCTAARRGGGGSGAAARPGRCPSAGRRCRAAPRGRATRTATGRGTAARPAVFV